MEGLVPPLIVPGVLADALLWMYLLVWVVFAVYGVHRIHLIRLFRRRDRDIHSRLARRMGYSGPRAGEELLGDYERIAAEVRAAFLRILA